MSSWQQKLESKKQELDKAQKDLRDSLEAIFKEACDEVFSKFPTLKAFWWEQYTPYFNDGDVCHFGHSADSPEFYFVEPGQENEPFEIEDYGEGGNGPSYYTAARKKKDGQALSLADQAVLAVGKVLKKLDNDDFEYLFGDGYRVIVTAKGVRKEEYEHD